MSVDCGPAAARAHAAARVVSLARGVRAGAGADLLPRVVLRRPRGGAGRAGRLRREGRGGREHPRSCGRATAGSRRTTTSAATAGRSWCPTAAPGTLRRRHPLPLPLLDLHARGRAPHRAVPRGVRRARPRRELSLHPGRRRHAGAASSSSTSRRPRPQAAGTRSRRQLGAVPERLRRYPLAELRVARRIDYEIQANWKVMLENYNECYHCGPVHPELCRLVPAFKQRGGSELDWERGIPHRDGAWTFTASGTTNRAAVRGPRRGRAHPPQGRADLSQLHAEPERRARGRVLRLLPARPRPDDHRQRVPLPSRRDGQARTSIRPTRWSSGTW